MTIKEAIEKIIELMQMALDCKLNQSSLMGGIKGVLSQLSEEASLIVASYFNYPNILTDPLPDGRTKTRNMSAIKSDIADLMPLWFRGKNDIIVLSDSSDLIKKDEVVPVKDTKVSQTGGKYSLTVNFDSLNELNEFINNL